MFSIAIIFVARCLLVMLFLPFSALDKLINRSGAVDQAAELVPDRRAASILIVAAFCVEVVMSLAILAGLADRLAALIFAGYCVATALLWKRFWAGSDFRLKGVSASRALFWAFLKNIALAGGFLMLAFGADASGVSRLLAHPLASSHPYTLENASGAAND